MHAGIALGKVFPRAAIQPSFLISKLRKRWFESSVGDHRGSQVLTQTSILVQEGTDIQELPLIVRKVKDVGIFCSESVKSALTPFRPASRYEIPKDHKNENDNSSVGFKKTGQKRIDIETEEGTAILFCSDLDYLKNSDLDDILNGLNSCHTTKGAYSFLESQIAHEINCRVALEGLKKVIELENSQRRKYKHSRLTHVDPLSRDAVLKQLVRMIAKSRDHEMILEGLLTLKRDKFSPPRNAYRDLLCDEALVRATDGEFTLKQLINVVRILSSYKDEKYRQSIDMLWVGIESRIQDIDTDTLVPLFQLLGRFNKSRNIVKIILERKLSDLWLNLSGGQMAEILNCLHDGIFSTKCLSAASKWAAVSMSTSKEKDLAYFIQSLHSKSYIDEKVEGALEEYIKAKASEIKDPSLIAAVTNYCGHLRVRNVQILSGCGEYFLKHGMDIPAFLLRPFFVPFGLLNVHPPNPERFWIAFDEILSERFPELKLNEILDILLACTYLEQYPAKFTDKLFTSYFLDGIHAQRDSTSVRKLKNKLKLFDTAMSLECKFYQGPRFPLDRSGKSLLLDVRIRRIVNLIYQPLSRLVGGEEKLSKSVVLNRLPLINFYVLDVLIHPFSVSAPVFNLNMNRKRNVNTAVLICLPEFYCRNNRHLIGPQVMRKRHLRKLGFRVTTLNYATLEDLVDDGDKLSKYLSERLDAAEDSL